MTALHLITVVPFVVVVVVVVCLWLLSSPSCVPMITRRLTKMGPHYQTSYGRADCSSLLDRELTYLLQKDCHQRTVHVSTDSFHFSFSFEICPSISVGPLFQLHSGFSSKGESHRGDSVVFLPQFPW